MIILLQNDDRPDKPCQIMPKENIMRLEIWDFIGESFKFAAQSQKTKICKYTFTACISDIVVRIIVQ